jgi:Acyl-CoA carboxylase epsilon subunit
VSEANEDPQRTVNTVMASVEGDEGGPPRPVLRVVRGEPDDDELAALVTVVAALAGRSAVRPAPARSPWRDRGRNIRPPIGPGPGAWRASGLPR